MKIGSEIQAVPAALLLTVTQVAALTSLGERTIWRWVAAGAFPKPATIGRLKRWHRRAVEEWVAEKVGA